MYIAGKWNRHIPSESSSAVKLGKRWGVRGARISTRTEVGKPQRPDRNTITFTARTDARTPVLFSTYIPPHCYTMLDIHIMMHTQSQKKNINFKSHMEKHNLSPAITFSPFQTSHCSKAQRPCRNLSSLQILITGYDPSFLFISIMQWLIL